MWPNNNMSDLNKAPYTNLGQNHSSDVFKVITLLDQLISCWFRA
jgi:hypothetical protein